MQNIPNTSLIVSAATSAMALPGIGYEYSFATNFEVFDLLKKKSVFELGKINGRNTMSP